MTLEPHSGVPLHRQLAAALRARIVAGEWPPGRLLPAQARIGYEYRVGKATVQAAVNALRGEGLVDVERGTGIRVRTPKGVEDVVLEPKDSVGARNPSPREREDYGVPEGVPLLVVTHPDGLQDLYPADRYRVVPPLE